MMKKVSKEDLAKIIGERLKEVRKATKDVPQKEVADSIGITKQALSSYESGRHVPELSILMQLADCYGCSIEYLLGMDEKITKDTVTDSEDGVIANLRHALDMLAPDEGNYLVESFSLMVNALSVSKANPERKHFIENIRELHFLLAEYIEVSTESGKKLAEESKQKSLTSETVTVALAQFFGFDDFYTLIEDIKRTGLKAAIPFSVEAKKALRIRTGWKRTKKSEQHPIEKMIEIKLEEINKE